MGLCNEELRAAGEPYPRTCQVCGLGPCTKHPPVEEIARLEALLAEERANAKMLLEVVRGQIVTTELQRELLRKCEEAK